MQYILTGFTQDMGFRVFAFERIGDDRLRTNFTVRADLALIRRYGIRLQDLPLMCRGLLDRCSEGEERRTLIFTEDEMGLYEKKQLWRREKPPRRRKDRRAGLPAKISELPGERRSLRLGGHPSNRFLRSRLSRAVGRRRVEVGRSETCPTGVSAVVGQVADLPFSGGNRAATTASGHFTSKSAVRLTDFPAPSEAATSSR